jgi:hypothetical protein
MTTRRAVLGLAALLATGLGLGACGVPSDSAPIVVDAAPAAGDPVGQSGAVKLPGREGANTATELAKRFFQAGAAADWDADREENNRIRDATNYARQFLAQDVRSTWAPLNDVLVVDVRFIDNLDSVTVTADPVGVLLANGAVGKLDPVPTFPREMRFQAVSDNGNMVLRPAPGSVMPLNLVLSLDGLANLFEDRPVYYWDKSNQFLVPDRRYVARGLSDEKRIKRIISEWQDGPSDFLKRSVATQPIPTLIDNPVLDGGRMVVNVTPLGQEANQAEGLRRLAAQIRWSTHRGSTSVDLEIQVASRSQYKDTDDKYLLYNPSQPRQGQGSPDEDRLFAIQEGRVVAVSKDATSPSILQQPQNANVVQAAVNRANNAAALVRRVDGVLGLWLGRNAEPRFIQVNFPAAPKAMSRPSYVPGGRSRVLVAVDGALYDVAPDGVVQPVLNAPPDVTAVAVAPDGARVALVAGGQAVVASLDVSAAQASIGDYLVLNTLGIVPQSRGVGWLYEDRLVVCGTTTMAEVAIDNGRVENSTPKNVGAAQLSQVSAVPGNPFAGTRGGVVVDAGGQNTQQGYYAYVSGLVDIVPLGGPSASPSPSPSASSGTGNASPTPKLTAPFYVDDVK